MPRALLIINAKASQAADCFTEIAGHLQAGGIEVERGEAKGEDGLRECIDRARARIDLLVVAGGDGTVRCAAEAIVAEPKQLMPLGIIPVGTANNVARGLGLPLETAKACQVVVEGRRQWMDLGRVNGRIFVSVVGIGLSTKVHEEVPAEQKRRWGSLSYAMLAVKLVLRRPPGFRATIRHEGGVLKGTALQITVCNGRYYGGHIEIQPEARLDDGLLDLSMVKARNPVIGFFKTLLPLRSGHDSPGLQLLQARRFEVRTRPVVKIDVEGATDLRTPAKIEVLPKAIEVFA